MMKTADRYRANADAFTARVEGVAGDQWENQSPCEDWKARDVVRHVVDASAMFLGYINQQLPPGPSVDEDPAGAWRTARDAIQHALEDPALAQAEYDSMFGKSTFEQGVARFLAPDLVVHTWDLARAANLDENLEEGAVLEVLEAWRPLDEAMRRPGGFGPRVESPPGADPQTQLLNFAGRRE
jgi:uncharacterized protein (TIGR03086 family)